MRFSASCVCFSLCRNQRAVLISRHSSYACVSFCTHLTSYYIWSTTDTFYLMFVGLLYSCAHIHIDSTLWKIPGISPLLAWISSCSFRSQVKELKILFILSVSWSRLKLFYVVTQGIQHYAYLFYRAKTHREYVVSRH